MLIGFLTLAELAGGVLLSLLADALSKSTIGGNGWSLQGNGALIVPVAGGPALLATGWSLLVLWPRGVRRRLTMALLAGVAALALELFAAFVPIAYSQQPTKTAALITRVFLLGLMPGLALAAGAGLARFAGGLPRAALLMTAALWIALIGAGLWGWGIFIYLIPLLLPLLLLMPLLWLPSVDEPAGPRNPFFLLAGGVLLLLGLLAGLAAGAVLIVSRS